MFLHPRLPSVLSRAMWQSETQAQAAVCSCDWQVVCMCMRPLHLAFSQLSLLTGTLWTSVPIWVWSYSPWVRGQLLAWFPAGYPGARIVQYQTVIQLVLIFLHSYYNSSLTSQSTNCCITLLLYCSIVDWNYFALKNICENARKPWWKRVCDWKPLAKIHHNYNHYITTEYFCDIKHLNIV